MTYPLDIPGIQLCEEKQEEITFNLPAGKRTIRSEWRTFALAKDAPFGSLQDVFLRLPSNQEVRFFDSTVNLKSNDPGEFITVQRRDGGLFYLRANHGWSSSWGKCETLWIAEYLRRVSSTPGSELSSVAFELHPCVTKNWAGQ